MVYTQEQITDNKFRRVLSCDVDSDELVWHRDAHNRIVEVIQGGNWKFQSEDELPISLTDGMQIYIPKETFHRAIKGSEDLIILITEEKE
jgi:hypothetical protein